MENITYWLINNIAIAILSFFVGAALTWIVSNRSILKISFGSLIHWHQKYRMSISYLFKIKIDNKYVLIKGNRIDQYQPIGGVYKYYESFMDNFNKWGVQNENEESFYEEYDLRIYVKGKNLCKVIKWFETMKNREFSVDREFVEELIRTDILSEDALHNARFEFINRQCSGVHKSQQFKCREVIIYDIIDVGLRKEDMDILLEKCQTDAPIILVDCDSIDRECVTIEGKSYKIGSHAKYIL
ncbi:MAG: hypothetical protein J1E64_13320 [Acetatifactor sp.]|nr:hypothetical protein [Acetatifactor sp.]